MLRRPIPAILLGLLSSAWLPAGAPAGTGGKPATQPAARKPKDNLDLWLGGGPAKPPKAVNPLATGVDPFKKKNTFRREDALPGVVEMSDGKQIPGGLYTTREKDWEVHVEAEKRWHRIPPIIVLSITAVVLEEKMDQRWRWKAMGVPERVYTGKEYPYRRFHWKFHLIDGSYVTGTVKGQPLWIEKPPPQTGRHGPMVIHERFTGPEGTKLADHPYVKRVIVSRKMFQKVLEYQAEEDTGEPKGKSAAAKGAR